MKKAEKIANELIKRASNGKYGVAENGKLEQTKTGLQGEIIIPNVASDIFPILPKFLLEYQFINQTVFQYDLLKHFPIIFIRNGQKRFDYEIITDEAIQDSSNQQFTPDASTYPRPESGVASETFQLTDEDEMKNKFSLFDSIVSDLANTPANALTIINTKLRQNKKVFEKVMVRKLWEAVNENITEDVAFSEDDIIVKQKELYDKMIELNTSRNDMTDTINGSTYTFDTKIEPNRFIVFVNKDFASSYHIDFKRNSFQLNEAKLPEMYFKAVYEIDFTKEYALKDQADLSGKEIIWIDEEALKNLGQFALSKRLETDRNYFTLTNYLKEGIYKVKGVKPIITFGEATPTPTATLANVVPASPTTAGGTDGTITFDTTIADFVGAPTATLTPTSGTTPLTLTDGANTGLTFEDLPAGTYTITILDGTSTIATQTGITITDPEA